MPKLLLHTYSQDVPGKGRAAPQDYSEAARTPPHRVQQSPNKKLPFHIITIKEKEENKASGTVETPSVILELGGPHCNSDPYSGRFLQSSYETRRRPSLRSCILLLESGQRLNKPYSIIVFPASQFGKRQTQNWPCSWRCSTRLFSSFSF